jgi:hypothetical protein
MSWIKNIKNGLVVITSTFVLYSLISFTFYLVNNLDQKNAPSKYDSNTIRATYPNYEQENLKYAVKIFEDYAAPKTSYHSFVGYRRNQYDGKAVTVGSDGFRNSINHSVNDSVWFFGGSTMWGTGSDDKRTIPSFFAKETGDTVLNLGESGYNSVQEFIQLQLMLLKGNKPKEVIFYDGVNDGYYFCQNDSQDQIRHAYTSRFAALKNDHAKAVRKLKEKSLIDFERILEKIIEFYLQPLAYFQSKADEAKSGSNLISDAPITSMAITKKYLHCDDPNFAKKAANLTIKSWRAVSALLQDQGIPVWYVLQPTATVNSHKYKLDHIINSKKQAIVNEKDSYESYYTALKNEFFASCDEFEDCSSFIDLSDLFSDIDDHIFIDTCHVSPNGNSLVSAALVDRIR